MVLRCFTPNSDTPYGGLMLDVSDGPMVIELPPGALMGTVNDLNQRWVLDMGLPGPDHGQGGKHLVLPPGYDGEVPDGYHTGTPTTNRMIGLLRALPPHGDLEVRDRVDGDREGLPITSPLGVEGAELA